MKALRVNRLLLGRHIQVDVHYGFRSGFAHPSKRGYEAIFGGNSRASSYFWFSSDEPEMFDRIDTVHTPPGNWKPKWGRPKVDPSAIRPVRIRYYRNPLGRLVKLHQSYQEMSTGLVYRSPFERQAATFR
jgi:hypothetical protein